jgi:predicted ATPase/transcriptional regulator with XRE-family HTH domain
VSLNAAHGSDFGSVLRRYRTAAGLSQGTLAARALISLQAVSSLERGLRRAPYRDTVERLAAALELSPDERADLEAAAERARSSSGEAGDQLSLEDLPPNNLPRRLTSFVGRDEVVAEIASLVSASPLVTVVGTGGVGKTRAAMQVGEHELGRWRDGVWFVEFAPVGDPMLVPSAVAAALGVQESPSRPLLASILQYLEKKRLLLLLDNCEHVIDEARAVVAAILGACPGVRVLCTSREPLRTAGERFYRLPTLAVPPSSVTSAEQAGTYGSVALFADRALAVDGSFALTDENAQAVGEVCRRLDGIPLAIELAAARIRVLSPHQLAEKLDERFSLLTTGDRTALPRQQTMRALIDWSYDLLSERERLLFDRLAIFVGGFGLEALSMVCTGDGIGAGDVLDLIASLVDKSLVVSEVVGDDARYRLLEATRQYAGERLDIVGERAALARRHASAYTDLAEDLERGWYTASERVWFAQAEAELDNWRAALEWSLGPRGDAAVGRRLAGALSRVWYSLAAAEGLRWVHVALEAPLDGTPASVLAQLDVTEAELYAAFGQYKASLPAAERALARLREIDDPILAIRARQSAGNALTVLGGDADTEGEPLLQHALAAARTTGNRRLVAMLLRDLGTARSRRRDVSGARAYYAEALAGFRAIGIVRQAASLAGHMAEVQFAEGDAEAALELAEEALAGHRALRNRRGEANDLCNMAAYYVALERFDDARRFAAESLALARDLQARVFVVWTLQHVVAIAALRQRESVVRESRDRERAARLLGFVDAGVVALDAVREYTEQQEYERVLDALRAALPAAELERLMDYGRGWTEDDAVIEASEI